MSGEEESVPVVVRRAGEDRQEINLAVHIHLDGDGVGPSSRARGKPGSWLMPVLLAVFAGGVALTAMEHYGGGRGAGPAPAGAATSPPPAPKVAGADQVPPELTAALREKPVVTPPPGVAPSTPSGPAAFGLGE